MDQLKSLRVFCKVCETGGFAAAARALDLSPAMVTRLVMDLEDRLGVRLLNRTTRRVDLTEAGARYLERVSTTLSQLDAADAELSASSSKPRGLLRVAAPPLLMQQELLAQLPAFRAKYPDVSVHLSASAPTVPDPAADLSFVLMRHGPASGDFVVRKMAVATAVLCAAPTYLAERGHPRHPEELLAHECFIAAHPDLPRDMVLTHADTVQTANVPFHARPSGLTSSSAEVLMQAALAGMGVLAQVSYSVRRQLERGELVRVLPSWHIGAMGVYATMPSRRHNSPAVKLFLDHLAQQWGDAQKDPWLHPVDEAVAPLAAVAPAARTHVASCRVHTPVAGRRVTH